MIMNAGRKKRRNAKVLAKLIAADPALTQTIQDRRLSAFHVLSVAHRSIA